MNRRSVIAAVVTLATLALAVIVIRAFQYSYWKNTSSFFELPPSPKAWPPPPTSALTGRLLQGIPCMPPCWEGLTPGVTTMEEARQIMERLQKAKQVTSARCSSGGDCWVTDKYGTTVRIQGHNGQVVYIDGQAQQESYGGSLHVDVQQVTDLLGEPSWVFQGWSTDNDCACIPSHAQIRYFQGKPEEVPRFRVTLLYLEHGAAFDFEVIPEDLGCICPYMRLVGFSYFTPVTSVAEFSGIQDRYGGLSASLKKDRFFPWHGFGAGYGEPKP